MLDAVLGAHVFLRRVQGSDRGGRGEPAPCPLVQVTIAQVEGVFALGGDVQRRVATG